MEGNDERIETYINRNGIQGDTDFMLAQLNAVNDAFNKVNGIKLGLGRDNSFGTATQSATNLRAATDSLSSSVNNYRNSQTQAAQATQQTISGYNVSSDAILRQANVLAGLKLQLQQNAALQKDLKKQLDDGSISLDQYQQKTAAAIVTQNEYKASISALNKELSNAAKADLAVPGSINAAQANNLQIVSERNSIASNVGATPEDLQRLAELNGLIDQNNILIDSNSDRLARQKINIGNYPTAFTTAFSTLDNELTKVSTALQSPALSGQEIADLSLKQQALQNATALVSQEFASTTTQANAYRESARQIGQVFGTDSEVFRTYASQVAEGVTQTQNLSQSVAQAGTRSNAFARGLSSVYSTLRQVAYAIPGIGLAGLIGLLLDPLITLGSNLVNGKKAAVDFNDEIQRTNFILRQTDDILTETDKSVSGAAENVDNLREHVKLAKDGFINKTEAVKLYNETMGKTTGIVNTLDEVEQKLAKNADAYIKFTLLKAAAQVASGKAAEQSFQAALSAQKSAESFSGFVANVNTANATAGGLTGEEVAALRAKELESSRQKAIKEANEQKDALLKIEQQFNDQAAEIAKQFNFFFDPKTAQQQVQLRVDSIDKQIQALTRYEDKQNEVYANEKNTYELRRAALVNYNNAVAKIIALNTQKSILGETGDPNAQAVTYSKEQTELQKAAIDGYSRLRQLDESYRLRKVTANGQIADDILNETIKNNEAIFQDDQKSLEDRLKAYKAYLIAQKELFDLQKNEKLESVGFSPQEIADFNNGLQVEIQGKKITTEELLAIQTDYETKVAALGADGAKKVYDITISSTKRLQEAVKSLNKNEVNSSTADQYNADLSALNEAYKKRLITVDGYLLKLAALNKQFTIDELKAQIEADSRKLVEQKEVEQKLENEIIQGKADLIRALEGGDQKEVDQNQARLDALLKAEGLTNAQILALRKKLAADTTALNKNTAEDQKKIALEKQQIEGQILQTGLNGIAANIDARYNNERAAIQKVIDAINAKAQTDIAAENASFDSAQVKADKIALINQRAAVQTAQLAQEQKKIDIQKAQFDKEKAIADIIINTAVSISKSLDKPYLIPFISALGAVEIAIVEAQPLPKYKYGAGINGSPKHPGGDAEVGHGKAELAITPEGKMYVTPSVPTKVNLPKDTTVLPDANAAINALIYSSLRGLDNSVKAPQDTGLLNATNQLIKENKKLQNIIANKTESHTSVTWHGLERSYRSGRNWLQYIDEITNFNR